MLARRRILARPTSLSFICKFPSSLSDDQQQQHEGLFPLVTPMIAPNGDVRETRWIVPLCVGHSGGFKSIQGHGMSSRRTSYQEKSAIVRLRLEYKKDRGGSPIESVKTRALHRSTWRATHQTESYLPSILLRCTWRHTPGQ